MADFDSVYDSMLQYLCEQYKRGETAVYWTEIVEALKGVTTDLQLIAHVQEHLRSQRLIVRGMLQEANDGKRKTLLPWRRKGDAGQDCLISPLIVEAVRDPAGISARAMQIIAAEDAARLASNSAAHELRKQRTIEDIRRGRLRPSPFRRQAENPPQTQNQYVTLDQIAAICGYRKRTAEDWKSKGKLPHPSIEGGGGKSDLWIWKDVRQVLIDNQLSRLPLPEKYPPIDAVR